MNPKQGFESKTSAAHCCSYDYKLLESGILIGTRRCNINLTIPCLQGDIYERTQ